MKKLAVACSAVLIAVGLLFARNPFTGEGGTGESTTTSTLTTQTNGTTLSTSVGTINFSSDFSLTDSPAGKTNVSINDTTLAADYLTTSSATATYQMLDQAQDFAVCISTPGSLGTVATLISPFRNYAVTISTLSARCIGGTSTAFMIEQRSIAGSNSAGTDCWTGDVTATTYWIGGTAADFTVPAGYALFIVPTAVVGDVDRLMIKGRYTRD